MKLATNLMVVLALAASAPAADEKSSSTKSANVNVRWLSDLDEAKDRAGRLDRLIVVGWTKPSGELADVLEHPSLRQTLASGFVTYRPPVAENPEEDDAPRYVILLDSDGKEVYRDLAVQEPDRISEVLNYAVRKHRGDPQTERMNAIVSKSVMAEMAHNHWARKISVAEQEARVANRPILLFFHDQSSAASNQMRAAMNAEPMRSFLNRGFVRARINSTDSEEPWKRFDVSEYPSILFLKPDLTVFSRKVGFRTTPELEKDLHNALGQFSSLRAKEEQGNFSNFTFLLYGSPADAEIANLLEAVLRSGVNVAWGLKGQPGEDQLQLELKLNRNGDWKKETIDVLTPLAKKASRPIALSVGWASEGDDRRPVLRIGSFTLLSDLKSVETELSRFAPRLAHTAAWLEKYGRAAETTVSLQDAEERRADEQAPVSADASSRSLRSEPHAAPAPQLVIIGDGGATGDADKEKIEKLIGEGVLKRVETVSDWAQTAEVTFQPKLDSPPSGGGRFFGSSPVAVPAIANSARWDFTPKWDEALRELSKQSIGTTTLVRFWEPGGYVGVIPQTDVRLLVPVDSTHQLSDIMKAALEKQGLVVHAEQRHPFFGSVVIPKGKELFPVYANEAGSPTAILKSNDDFVDVRLMLEEGHGLRGEFGRATTVLERAPAYVIQNAPKEAGGRRVVGILVSPEDGRLLRAAEREGQLQAVRRDPKDVEDQVSQIDRERIRSILLPKPATKPVEGNASTPPTSIPSTHQTKIIKLQHARASSMVGLLAQVIRVEGFAAAADERTNSVLVTAPDDETANLVEAILAKLDSEPSVHGQSNPLATLPSGQAAGAKPLAELKKAYEERETIAARQAKVLRDEVANRPPGLRDQKFKTQEKESREELAAAVRESFAARQAMLAAELEALKSKIADTQRSLELRNKAADEIVARRVEDLLSPELNWDASSTAAPTGSGPPLASQPSRSAFAAAGTFPPAATRFAESPVQATGGGGGQIEPARPNSYSRGGRKPTAETRASSGTPGGDAPEPQDITTQLTGIWETGPGLDMMGMEGDMGAMAMGMAPAMGGEMGMMSGAAGPRLIIYGDRAALYEKNEQKRLWKIEVERSGRTLLHFIAQDDQAGMQGVFDSQGRSLTIVSTGEEGAQIVRYRRTVSAVPPEWAKRMQAGGKTEPAPVVAPRQNLQTSWPAGSPEAELLSNLAGIWTNRPQIAGFGGMGGMGMGGYADAAMDPVLGGIPQTTFLVMHAGQAALYEKNERKRLWSIAIEQLDETEARLNFVPADAKSGMQGSYALKKGGLTVVSAGEEGPTIEHYSRVAPIVPPEWASAMKAAAPISDDAFANLKPSDELLRGTAGYTTRTAPKGNAGSGRNPSDYLELLKSYQPLLDDYERLLESVGKNHPQARKLQQSRQFQEIEILRQEFQAELEAAAAQVELKRAELSAARIKVDRARLLLKQNAMSKTEHEQQEAALQVAEAQLQVAESRLKLFETTKDKIFPKHPPTTRQPSPEGDDPAASPPPAAPSPAAPSAKTPAPTTPKAAAAPVAPPASAAAPADADIPDEFKTRPATPGPAAAPVDGPSPEIAPGPAANPSPTSETRPAAQPRPVGWRRTLMQHSTQDAVSSTQNRQGNGARCTDLSSPRPPCSPWSSDPS